MLGGTFSRYHVNVFHVTNTLERVGKEEILCSISHPFLGYLTHLGLLCHIVISIQANITDNN